MIRRARRLGSDTMSGHIFKVNPHPTIILKKQSECPSHPVNCMGRSPKLKSSRVSDPEHRRIHRRRRTHERPVDEGQTIGQRKTGRAHPHDRSALPDRWWWQVVAVAVAGVLVVVVVVVVVFVVVVVR